MSRISSLAAAAGVAALAALVNAGGSPWNTPANQQLAAQTLAQMSLQDKLTMVHGYNCCKPYVGMTPPLQAGSISIPPLHLEDGPQVREN